MQPASRLTTPNQRSVSERHYLVRKSLISVTPVFDIGISTVRKLAWILCKFGFNGQWLHYSIWLVINVHWAKTHGTANCFLCVSANNRIPLRSSNVPRYFRPFRLSSFLVAHSRFYKSLCWSVRRSVGRSVGLSVGHTVGFLVFQRVMSMFLMF